MPPAARSGTGPALCFGDIASLRFLSIANNAAERVIKTVVIGRKNWLFAGSDNGGRTAGTIFGQDPLFKLVFTR